MRGVKLILSVDAVSRPLTGIGRYAYELARWLPHLSGIEDIRYFSLGRWVETPESLLVAPPMTHAARSKLTGNKLALKAYSVMAPKLFGYRLNRFRGHMFHSPNFLLPSFAGRSIATFHDLSIFLHPEFHPTDRVGFLRREIEASLRRADFLVTDSEFTRAEVIDYFSWPADRVRAVPLGISSSYRPRLPAETDQVLARHGLSHGGYVLFVGTVEPRKNLDGLMAAYAGLAPTVRSRYPLVVVGGKGWRSEDTHARLQAAVQQGWARYLGYVDEAELPVLYAGARGFAYPSFYEGFGLPVLEAMASRVPVLCSDRASLPEVAAGTAIVVDPEDIQALTEGLARLIERDPELDARVERALERAKSFTWETTAREMVDVYRGLS